MSPNDELAALRNRVAALEVLIVAMVAHIEQAGRDGDATAGALLATMTGDTSIPRKDLALEVRLAAGLIDDALAKLDQIP